MSELSAFRLTFTALGKAHADYAKRAGKKSGAVAHTHGRGKNRLAELREKATAKPEPAKTRDKCQNKYYWLRGVRFIACAVDCPDHGSIKENAAFSRRTEAAECGRQKRAGVKSY